MKSKRNQDQSTLQASFPDYLVKTNFRIFSSEGPRGPEMCNVLKDADFDFLAAFNIHETLGTRKAGYHV